MKVEVYKYNLKLKYPFGISGNTRIETPVVFVKLSANDVYGWGEASLPPYLPFNQEDIINCFKRFNFSAYSWQELTVLLDEFKKINPHYPPAWAALDIAINDLMGKKLNKPIWQLYDVNPKLMKPNVLTIGIDTPEVIVKKVNEATRFKILKVKIGSNDDISIIKTIRSVTNKPIIADANQGIKDKFQALELCKWLHDQNCLLLEQPLAKNDLNGHLFLAERSPIPIIADESFQTENDLERIKNHFNGINIKLMKCGGIRSAYSIIQKAKRYNLKIMMGSMNESSCANLAAAQIAPLADWVDLDGPFLITNNPFEDFIINNDGRIMLTDNPGLGLIENAFYIQQSPFME
jgi:L-alanine-DL-glutamate epimerase-like enolase superfamily enzyme